MCGIAGVVGYQNSSQIVNKMLSIMAHRGPDDCGVFTFQNGAMGMCRLRIRSAVSDAIPFELEYGKYGFNGEIYGLLQKDGTPILSKAPTGGKGEIETFLSTLNAHFLADGMYAISFLSPNLKEFKIYRDKYGIKPLYIRTEKDNFAFASEIPTLLLKEFGSMEIDADTIDELLIFGQILNNKTLYKNISQLPKGTSLDIFNQELCSHHTLDRKKTKHIKLESLNLRSIIRESLNRCLLSDRPCGLSISGGLDSSILAYELNDMGVENLKTVSILVEGSEDGILKLEDLHLPPNGAWTTWEHHYVEFTPDDLQKYLLESIKILGQPTRMTSFPLYLKLAELTKKAGAVVLLSGEGADEIFAGYEDYSRWYRNWKDNTSMIEHVFKFFVPSIRQRWIEALIGNARLEKAKEKFYQVYRDWMMPCPLRTLLKIEKHLRLEPLLVRTDVCLMRYSIEGRVPFLHAGIPEKVSTLEDQHLFDGDITKPLLRKTYSGLLGARKIPKRRFRIPLIQWFKGPLREWVHATLNEGIKSLDGIGIMNNTVQDMLSALEVGDAEAASLIFTLLSFVLWNKYHNHFQ